MAHKSSGYKMTDQKAGSKAVPPVQSPSAQVLELEALERPQLA
jgi:hypothetical protein